MKVIDSAEKLNCTLAHELCHLAAWAIDKEMKPDHGPAFKSWWVVASSDFQICVQTHLPLLYIRGRKIMRARRDITVTTKHSYEIGECATAALFLLAAWEISPYSLQSRYHYSLQIPMAMFEYSLCEGLRAPLKIYRSHKACLRCLLEPTGSARKGRSAH